MNPVSLGIEVRRPISDMVPADREALKAVARDVAARVEGPFADNDRRVLQEIQTACDTAVPGPHNYFNL